MFGNLESAFIHVAVVDCDHPHATVLVNSLGNHTFFWEVVHIAVGDALKQ
jgi:hypothetical protein